MSLQTNTTKLQELKEKAMNLPDQNPLVRLQTGTIESVIGDGHEEFILPDLGFDGFSSILFKSAVPKLQSKSITNDLKYQVVYSDEGYDGLEAVEILEPNLEIAYVMPSTEDQIIKPSDGYAAISEARVYGDANLVPENIKEGVSIFGVEGNSIAHIEFIGVLNSVNAPWLTTTNIVSENTQRAPVIPGLRSKIEVFINGQSAGNGLIEVSDSTESLISFPFEYNKENDYLGVTIAGYEVTAFKIEGDTMHLVVTQK